MKETWETQHQSVLASCDSCELRIQNRIEIMDPAKSLADLFQTEWISMTSKSLKTNSAAKPVKEPKLTRTHAPAGLSPVDWQRGLRRQFGREQAFGLENIGSEPFFSEFRVSNPVSK